MTTLAQILDIMPAARQHAATYIDALNAAMAEFAINTPERVAAFLAQIAHESNELSSVEENLNYSADGLANTWPVRYALEDAKGFVRDEQTRRYLPNALARSLHRRPEAIANNVYACRMGNGDEASGDGWKYRGAGLVQLTGKDAHIGAALYFDIDPDHIGDWLRSPVGAARSAAWYWKTHGCNEMADEGQFLRITKAINGGTIGQQARVAYYEAAKGVLNA